MEKILLFKDYPISNISEKQYTRLFFNILPGSLHFVHYLAISKEPKHMEIARRGYELTAE